MLLFLVVTWNLIVQNIIVIFEYFSNFIFTKLNLCLRFVVGIFPKLLTRSIIIIYLLNKFVSIYSQIWDQFLEKKFNPCSHGWIPCYVISIFGVFFRFFFCFRMLIGQRFSLGENLLGVKGTLQSSQSTESLLSLKTQYWLFRNVGIGKEIIVTFWIFIVYK